MRTDLRVRDDGPPYPYLTTAELYSESFGCWIGACLTKFDGRSLRRFGAIYSAPSTLGLRDFLGAVGMATSGAVLDALLQDAERGWRAAVNTPGRVLGANC